MAVESFPAASPYTKKKRPGQRNPAAAQARLHTPGLAVTANRELIDLTRHPKFYSVFAPKRVLEHVVVHELAPFKTPNAWQEVLEQPGADDASLLRVHAWVDAHQTSLDGGFLNHCPAAHQEQLHSWKSRCASIGCFVNLAWSSASALETKI
jgi:hypothetical protein